MHIISEWMPRIFYISSILQFFQFWKFDNTDTVMLLLACLLNLELTCFFKIFRGERSIWLFLKWQKESISFRTSHLFPCSGNGISFFPKELRSLYGTLSVMVIFFFFFPFQVSRVQETQGSQTDLNATFHGPLAPSWWTTLSTPPWRYLRTSQDPKVNSPQPLGFHKLIWRLLLQHTQKKVAALPEHETHEGIWTMSHVGAEPPLEPLCSRLCIQWIGCIWGMNCLTLHPTLKNPEGSVSWKTVKINVIHEHLPNRE